MSISRGALAAAWKEVLTLSALKAEENVAILTGPQSNPLYIDIVSQILEETGVRYFRLDLPAITAEKAVGSDPTGYIGRTSLERNPGALAALQGCDLVIDLMFLLFSPEQAEILGTGTRILLAVEPPEVLLRMKPTLDDKRRVCAAAEELQAAKRMYIASDAGTDLVVELGQYPVLREYGFAEEAGRWDHWPSGFVATWPNEGTASGCIVIDRGDIILPFKNFAQSPIELTVSDGYITNIAGSVDAEYLREYFESFEDPEVYAISHLGWGLQRRAKWTTLGLYDKAETIAMDARAFQGNFLFSTGPNTEAGGTRNTPCHLDIPMRKCSVSLDGNAMTRKGVVIPAAQR